MASVMAIGSEVFGSCGREINVSVEVENGEAGLYGSLKYLRLLAA